jgi:hypothetical protein
VIPLAALYLAAILSSPPGLVATVWDMAGLDGVAVVWCESRFNPRAVRSEPRGHTSWGLWQLDDEFHLQHRGDLLLHCVEGAAFLAECKAKTHDLAHAVALYNGSPAWGREVQAKRDALATALGRMAWR